MFKLVILRTAALLIGSAAIVISVNRAVDPIREVRAFHATHVCVGGVPTPAADADGCITVEYGVVTSGFTASDGSNPHVDFRVASRMMESGVSDQFYNAVAVGQQIEVHLWRGHAVKLVSDRADTSETPGTDPLFVDGIVAWAGLGLVLWFLAGDGTLGGMFGMMGMRVILWMVGGACFVMLGLSPFLNRQGLAADLVAGAFAIFGLVLALVFVLIGREDPDTRSLLDLAWRRWGHRTIGRLREHGEA